MRTGNAAVRLLIAAGAFAVVAAPAGCSSASKAETSEGLSAAATPPATGATVSGGSRSDIDGDGDDDVVVGMPAYAGHAGAVDVRGTDGRPLLLRAGDLGGSTEKGAGFGRAIALGHLDHDRYADLVIGAPGEGAGQVYVVFGGPGGLDLADAFRLPHPPGTASTGTPEFGRALAMYSRGAAQYADGDNHLFVGAPGADVDGKAQAGQVWHYRITAGGTGRVTTGPPEVLSQDTGERGAAEAGDRFGEVLAPMDQVGVVVGVPGEDAGRVRDAGAVWSMPLGPDGKVAGAREWSQGSAKVPGRAAADNRFGAAVSSRGSIVAVGVPGADVGSARDAGLVQVFRRDQGDLVPGRTLSQNSRLVPGVAEPGDRFGAALAVGISISGHGTGTVDVAIGVPGEDIGSQADAGMVALVPVTGPGRQPVTWLRQGRDLRGASEAGDRLGSVLTVTRGGLFSDEDYADRLLLGAPGEDIGPRADAGVVQRVLEPHDRGSANWTFSGGYRNARSYGQVLPSSSD